MAVVERLVAELAVEWPVVGLVAGQLVVELASEFATELAVGPSKPVAAAGTKYLESVVEFAGALAAHVVVVRSSSTVVGKSWLVAVVGAG